MNIVSTRIIEMAKERNVSDQAICRLLGAHRNKVDDWKKSKSSPTHDEVIVIADYFGVTTDYLLGRTRDPKEGLMSNEKPTALFAGLSVSEEDVSIANRVMNLPEADRVRMLDYLALLESQDRP